MKVSTKAATPAASRRAAPWPGYAFAVAASIGSLILHLALGQIFGNQIVFLIFVPAVIVSAAFCGVGTG